MMIRLWSSYSFSAVLKSTCAAMLTPFRAIEEPQQDVYSHEWPGDPITVDANENTPVGTRQLASPTP